MRKSNPKTKMSKQLIINGKSIYNFDYDIDMYFILENKVIVLLDVLAKKSKINENVYCVDMDGNLIWQMEYISRLTADSPIVGMRLENKNALKVFDWSGEYFFLDVNNGKIIDSGRGKGKRCW